MTSMELRQFVEQQAMQYLKHRSIINKAEATLRHQHLTQSQGNIPKKHRPKPPTVVDTDCSKGFTETFAREYKKFFFDTLQKAITHNTVTLELEKARCLDILRQTERVLCQSSMSPSLLAKYHTDFLQKLGITDHQVSPELQHKLQSQELTHLQSSTEAIAIVPNPSTHRELDVTDHHVSPELQCKLQSQEPTHSQPSTEAIAIVPSPSAHGQHQQVTHAKRGTTSKDKRPIHGHTTPMTTKRKNTTLQPPAQKQLKIDHFLFKGRKPPPNPS